ncbi:hypothetical protein BDN72DRAFT_812710 [Pluteus cervinus]|uniref:Uncharacterized protein n=1 Tax=Pluteus cervinus TaxID=181527 RepID=A0ACD3B949_9AGAR|nr:hypothetical protein BDN72DRAFT_812710 [Pluteus cervinus]
MHNFNDPARRTSINSLLNPPDASAYPAQPTTHLPSSPSSSNQSPSRDHRSVSLPALHNSGYSTPYSNGASYSLRAANWDMSEDANKLTKSENNSPQRHRHFSQPHQPQLNTAAPSTYTSDVHASPMPGLRMGDSSPFLGGQMWSQQPQQVQNMQYSPPIAPLYSDERTAISGDYQPQNGDYSPRYPPPPGAPTQNNTWQASERVSVRLAARGTVPPPPALDPPYTNASYYHPPQPSMYNMSYPQQHTPTHQHHLPPSQHPSPSRAPPPVSPQHLPRIQEFSGAQPEGKRPLPDGDDASQPKAKRAKSKAKTSEAAPGTSKRGYTTKKRNEAAQIAAQNAHLMPTVSYAPVPGTKGKGADGRMQIVSVDGSQAVPTNGEASGPLHPELQFARCMSNRYRSETFPRCVSCTRRWAGDTCRFQGIRYFLKDHQRNIVGLSFVESQKADAPTMNFPGRWNVPLQPEHHLRTKETIARALLPTLLDELKHLELPEIIRRPRESEVRATCDTCMTSIFSSSWMCRLCGREACSECFSQVRELTTNRPGADQAEILALQARREKHAHSNPFFLSCTRRSEHQAKDFSPMSRFCKAELEKAIEDMQNLLETRKTVTEVASPSRSETLSRTPSSPTAPSTDSVDKLEVGQLDGYVPACEARILSRRIRRFTDHELTEDVFRKVWAEGEPLVVTDLLHKFRIQWTPEYFVSQYGTQNCLIIECQTDQNKRITVAEFFEWFGKYEGRTECWKLKDWPPSTDFKSAFPELYTDFTNAVPVPNYVRRDGVMNIASHFPLNTVSPDLGPKMYNAMASNMKPGSKGSTRLHMDMADALNIMTYAAPLADGSPGCAAWDLFSSRDSDKLREFLRKKHKVNAQHDPIHSQQFYLDEVSRNELAAEGILSYRVYQRPGEAVFIPAGCAHQVSNMSDCIKVAMDFVSPENIAACEKLTKEFREQNQSMVWKEDVLQLRTMMWFAWLSCCQQDMKMMAKSQDTDG